MKSIAEQYHETLAQARKVKPRSERKTVLTERLRDLMRRQLRIESRKHRRAG